MPFVNNGTDENPDWEFEATGGSQDKYTADQWKTDSDGESDLDALRAEQAEQIGVSRPAYIGYAEVIANYAARSDVEPLADRRARHQGEAITDADFTRHANYTGDNSGAVHTSRQVGPGETPEDTGGDDGGTGDGE